VCGANEDDHHLKGVEPGRDFTAEFFDLRAVDHGDPCAQCGAALKVAKAIEIGHIFKLGYKYSQSMGARVLNEAGKEVTPIMGSYGIGMERILTSAVEQNHDTDGIALPPSIAPFEVVVTPVNYGDPKMKAVAEDLYRACRAEGLDVLLDDRDERPGVKFKDADLIGAPWRITVGKKVTSGQVEVVERSTRRVTDVTIPDVIPFVRARLRAGQGGSP
jgi:prolyl-tRNA synthetase